MPLLGPLASSLAGLAATVTAVGSIVVGLVVIIRSFYHIKKIINEMGGK